MIEPDSVANLKEAIADCIRLDEGVLTSLREEIRPLKAKTRRIQPRATTSISLVGTDGGNNQLQFDPFLIQIVRVVDSSNNEYCLEAVSPTTPIELLNARQFDATGADSVVTSCGSCRMNFAAGAQHNNWNVPVESLVELVADSLAGTASASAGRSIP